MNKDDFGGIKQQLWDYYKKIHEYAVSIAEEVTLIDLFTGSAQRELYAPVGLRDELIFVNDEIDYWSKYEKKVICV